MKIYFIKDNSCGDGEIGKHIMVEILKDLASLAKEGEAFIFVNEGVNFVTKVEFEELIKLLQEASDRGVGVYVCDYSLKELGLSEFVKVGCVVSIDETAVLLNKGVVVTI